MPIPNSATNWGLPQRPPWVQECAVMAHKTEGNICWFTIKDITKDTDEQPEEGCTGQGLRGGLRASVTSLAVPPSPLLPVLLVTDPDVLQTLCFRDSYGGFITEASSIINSISSAPAALRGWGWGRKAANHSLVFLVTRSPIRVTSSEQKTLLLPRKSQGV